MVRRARQKKRAFGDLEGAMRSHLECEGGFDDVRAMIVPVFRRASVSCGDEMLRARAQVPDGRLDPADRAAGADCAIFRVRESVFWRAWRAAAGFARVAAYLSRPRRRAGR